MIKKLFVYLQNMQRGFPITSQHCLHLDIRELKTLVNKNHSEDIDMQLQLCKVKIEWKNYM